jgi:phosphate starvation-inducible membrane PsiE
MSEAKEFQRELADMVPGPVVLDEVPGMATFALEYGSMEAFLRGTYLLLEYFLVVLHVISHIMRRTFEVPNIVVYIRFSTGNNGAHALIHYILPYTCLIASFLTLVSLYHRSSFHLPQDP